MKNKRSILILLMVVVAMLSIVPALTVSAQDSLIENLCLVTDVGKINDGTFNQFAYEGGKKAADEFGLNYKYIETVATTDYAKNIDTCVSEGFKAIITVGFLIADATDAAAKANPDVYFMGVDQNVADPAPKNWTTNRALSQIRPGRFDYVWLIDPGPFNQQLVAGMTPVWRGPGSILYRLQP